MEESDERMKKLIGRVRLGVGVVIVPRVLQSGFEVRFSVSTKYKAK